MWHACCRSELCRACVLPFVWVGCAPLATTHTHTLIIRFRACAVMLAFARHAPDAPVPAGSRAGATEYSAVADIGALISQGAERFPVHQQAPPNR
jgi:hypothetical protein